MLRTDFGKPEATVKAESAFYLSGFKCPRLNLQSLVQRINLGKLQTARQRLGVRDTTAHELWGLPRLGLGDTATLRRMLGTDIRDGSHSVV
jgi:hypothetical protein